MSAPVFFDPSGRRRRVVNRLSMAVGIGGGVLAALFVISVLLAPFVPQAATSAAPLQRPQSALRATQQARTARRLAERARKALLREVAVEERMQAQRLRGGAGDTIVAAFYVIWQRAGLASLRANADRLTHVLPEWLHVDSTGSRLDLRDWDPDVTPSNRDVLGIARAHGIAVVPVLNNAAAGAFDPVRAHTLLAVDAVRRGFIAQLDSFLTTNRLDGVNVDFENLAPADYPLLADFLDELQGAIGVRGKIVSVDIEAALAPALARRLAQAADFAVLMAYAQHGPANAPGPLAAAGWLDSTIARLGPAIGPDKLVLGLGSYGLDWPAGARAAGLTFEGALMAARTGRPGEDPGEVVDFDAQALNPTFTYSDSAGHGHEVWFLDAATARNTFVLAAGARARGTALWVLGAEDPSLWPLLGSRTGRRPATVALDTIPFPYGVEYVGDGEILTLAATARVGVRSVETDSATGLVDDEKYVAYPAATTIHRAGYRPGLLALTFDDGPDDVWTPQILDLLDSLHVPGTFFLVGRNIERHPGVVRRIWAAGHEIGNHTFTHPNMAEVGRRRAVLELNATQRALQSTIGRSTTLFRVPYNADAEPSNAREAEPLGIATALGYETVGEQLDPQDWNLYRQTEDGDYVPRGTPDVVASILRQARTVRGNVILLHSAGGDRHRTVEALRVAVPLLQREGYRFVRVSELMGRDRYAVMPLLTPRDQLVAGVDRVSFDLADALEVFLGIGFLTALVLALARAGFVVTLALIARVRERHRTFDPAYRPRVAVLIAAYNEAPVIAATVGSVLASDYQPLSVTVVDDGSADGTAEVVAAAFGADARVRLVRQPNGGKATALNRALAETDAEVVVCFDADTQVAPEAIGRLVRHFADPRVAAVAGNVKVGNRINTITIWQSIEYITSQNLDRRAYALLNAVTVVPGAVGAWRRSAVVAAGGYETDTLAEDMDLTWRLRRAGGRVANEPDALAYTEAPDTLRTFLRQRRRWSFGAMQVLWKHRAVLFHEGAFGWIVVPTVWLFQVLFQLLAPLVDLRLFYTLIVFGTSAITTAALQADWQPLPALAQMASETAFFYAVFFLVDLLTSAIAVWLDRERARDLWWLFWQRFVYRQTLYVALWQAMVSAVKGRKRGWGKLERKGVVAVKAA